MMIYWQRRLTRLELALYAGLIGVVLAFFLRALLQQMELAERTAVELSVLRINSAIQLRAAQSLIGSHKVAALDGNPLEVAQVTLSNYRGEIETEALHAVEGGSWVFDRKSRELIYVPRLSEGLETSDPDRVLRFSLARQQLVMLVPTHKYVWR